VTITLDELTLDPTDYLGGPRATLELVESSLFPAPADPVLPPTTATGAVAGGLILWPIRLASTTFAVRLTSGGTTETVSMAVGGGTRNYWMADDGQADADGSVGGIGDLVALLETVLNLNSAGATYTVTLDSSLYLSITVSGVADFQILWSNAATTLTAAHFGFPDSTYPASAAASVTSPSLPYGIWRPGRAVATDTRDRVPSVGAVGQAISGLVRVSDLVSDPKAHRNLSWRRFPAAKALTEYQASAEPTGSWQYAWRNSVKLGRPLRYYENETSRTATSYGLYRLRSKATDGLERSTESPARWNLSLELARAD
jgi:hypothetical protein